jgi:hypothetical protein
MIAELVITSGLGPILIRWIGWEWGGIGQAFVESLWLLCACVAILYDILKYNLSGVVLTYNFNFEM